MNFADLFPMLPQVAAGILLADFLRYFVAALTVYVLVWQVFARVLERRKILPDGPKPGQILREFKHSMSTVVLFALTGLSVFMMERLGFTMIYTDVNTYGWAWWWGSLVLVIVLHDAWFYWTHRLLHRPWWFVRFHVVHHRSVQPTPWAAYSFHPVEAMMQAVFFLLMVVIIPLHDMVLFSFTSWMIVRNVLAHSAYELMPWRACTQGPLRWLLTNSHHHFHHCIGSGNFGLYFAWWDRWMNTEDLRYLAHGDRRYLAASSPSAARERAHG